MIIVTVCDCLWRFLTLPIFFFGKFEFRMFFSFVCALQQWKFLFLLFVPVKYMFENYHCDGLWRFLTLSDGFWRFQFCLKNSDFGHFSSFIVVKWRPKKSTFFKPSSFTPVEILTILDCFFVLCERWLKICFRTLSLAVFYLCEMDVEDIFHYSFWPLDIFWQVW